MTDLDAIRARIDDPPDGWDFFADADVLLGFIACAITYRLATR